MNTWVYMSFEVVAGLRTLFKLRLQLAGILGIGSWIMSLFKGVFIHDDCTWSCRSLELVDWLCMVLFWSTTVEGCIGWLLLATTVTPSSCVSIQIRRLRERVLRWSPCRGWEKFFFYWFWSKIQNSSHKYILINVCTFLFKVERFLIMHIYPWLYSSFIIFAEDFQLIHRFMPENFIVSGHFFKGKVRGQLPPQPIFLPPHTF